MAFEGGTRLSKRRRSVTAHIRYRFDRAVAAGPIVLIGWLAVMTLLFALAAGALISVGHIRSDGHLLGFREAGWESLLRTLDPGTMSSDKGRRFRIVMLIVTLAGLLFVSTLIAIINQGVQDVFRKLRQGRSAVVEKNHTVVLGWSSGIYAVLTQLDLAQVDTRREGCVVLLCDRDAINMRDDVNSRVERVGRTRFVFRSGDPTRPDDLRLVAPNAASAIIIMAPDRDREDATALRTLLALQQHGAICKISDGDKTPHPTVAVELRQQATADTIKVMAPKQVISVLGDQLMARIIVQSIRQNGLSRVYDELL